jgi:hypothetical protein
MLMKLKNVKAIGIAFKQSGGQLLDRLCIKVYVSQKIPKDQLPHDQIIPTKLDGCETDVEEMESPVAL